MATDDSRRRPQDVIADLATKAGELVRTAKRNKQSLTGSNFYAEKLVELRTDATIAFRQLGAEGVGEVTALAELLETVFSPSAAAATRRDAIRDLRFQLKTKWAEAKPSAPPGEEDAIFPLALLTKTRRGYLVHIARQMNGSYVQGWYDACAVMMRRLLESSILEAYEARGIQAKVKNANGDYFQLTELIANALTESGWTLSRNTRTYLPQLREVGHLSAHSRYFTADKSDIEKVRSGCRVVVEEFLRHANLL
jgi:hypothetical protein